MLESAAMRPHRHPRESGDPLVFKVLKSKWIPAFAGMTRREVEMAVRRAAVTLRGMLNE